MANYKSVKRTGTVSNVDDAFSELEDLGSEMGDWRDNLEEKFSSTDKYQRVSDAADALEGLSQPNVPESLADLPISYSEYVNKRGLPRSARCTNAVSIVRAAIDALQEFIDEKGKEDAVEGSEASEEDKEKRNELCDKAQSLIDDLETIADEAENVEFPGMYG